MRFIVSALALTILFFGNASAAGYLAEYYSPTEGVVRAPDDSFDDDDVISNPKWLQSPISLLLCTNASTDTFASDYGTLASTWTTADINYQSGGASRTNQVLSDITDAQDSWSQMTGADGSALSFAVPTATNCSTSSTSQNRIRFHDLGDDGPIAYTAVTYSETISSGQVEIIQADILFNSNCTTSSAGHCYFEYTTVDCRTAGGTGAACDDLIGGSTGANNSITLSFLGVLTHEMGHMLGLAHSMVLDTSGADGSATATMWPAVQDQTDSVHAESLHLDDKISFLNLYYPNATLPSGYEGIVSGQVRRSATYGQRGAHVFAFNTTTHQIMAGAFTGISGTKGDNDGSFTLRGLPLNTNFVLITEPVQQDFDYLDYFRFNIPIQLALEAEAEGYQEFNIEAYPETSIQNIRSIPSTSLSGATVFNLTSGSPSETDLRIYISQDYAAPNDGAVTELELITEDDSLKVKLVNPSSLALVEPTGSIRLTATKGNKSYDWSSSVPDFTYEGTESEVTVDLGRIDPSEGVYTLSARISDATFGNFSATGRLTITSALQGSSSGGGGCLLRPNASANPFVLVVILSMFALAMGILSFRFRREVR